jgi:hemerythrin-like domain-containing protein
MMEAGVRNRFLEDHARLRGKAEVLESLALRILRGDEDLGSALRLKGEEILEHLVCHMGWEEKELLPLLRQFGRSDIASRLVIEHAAQRERFEGDLHTLQNTERRPLDLAKHIVEFLGWLERDMQAEEENVLGALNPHLDPHAGSRHRHSP